MEIGLFNKSFQTIGPKGLNFQGLMGSPWSGYKEKLVKSGVKPYPWAYFSKFPDWGHNSRPE